MTESAAARSYYIFVVVGMSAPEIETRLSAKAVLSARLKDERWPLNPRTPFQAHVKLGDVAVFYVAGAGDPDRHTFVAEAEVAGSRVAERRRSERDITWLGSLAPTPLYVPLRNPIWYSTPISVRPLLHSLTFVRNKARWGSHFQGGIVRISKHDYALVSPIYQSTGSTLG